MIITIEGRRESGKSSIAHGICEGKNHVVIDWKMIGGSFGLSEVTKETEYIIVEDVDDMLSARIMFGGYSELKIERLGERQFVIPMPHVILIKKSK